MLDSALGWIGELVRWFGDFVPRWSLVRATEGAVKFLPGGKTCEYGPGIVWYWPATTEIDIVAVVRQVKKAKPQTLMTKDGISVFVCGILIYSIDNLHTFLVDNHDANDNLDDMVELAIRKSIVNKTFAEIQEARAKMDNALTREAQKALSDFGVRVEVCRLTDFSKARVSNLVGSGLMNLNLGKQE